MDPLIIAQPDFIYLSVADKLQRIDQHHAMQRELKKTREMKQMLELADKETQQRLLSGFNEIEAILQ